MTPLMTFDNTYETLPDVFYQKIPLHGAPKPSWVYFNFDLAEDLGLDGQRLMKEGLPIFSGQAFPEGAASIAQAYMGHQFGHQTMLGDGRANLIGEVRTPSGARYDLQLKGSGPTPYSRGGDGRAALGPMLKEVLSEALYKIGIPTSRPLALVKTGSPVLRQRQEEGAILTRAMASHLRVGTFEFAAKLGRPDHLKALADYAIARHDPDVKEADKPYGAFYGRVIRRQAETIAKWMAYGFVHGVMNTDNMAISGETFDYGPWALIDHFDPHAVYSSIDRQGRYAYGNQPTIGLWNLHRFGEALMPLLKTGDQAPQDIYDRATEAYTTSFRLAYDGLMRARLGLGTTEAADEVLADFYRLIETTKTDYHQFFIDLTTGAIDDQAQDAAIAAWVQRWKDHIRQTGDLDTTRNGMRHVNPSVVPRNVWVQESIQKAEQGDFQLFEDFYAALMDPFSYDARHQAFGPVADQAPYVTYCGT